MKSIKISLLSAVGALCFAFSANAQEINQAIELYNNGAEAIKAKDWTTAITEFNQALVILNELGEEGDENMAQDIKDRIPSLHLFLGQELAKATQVEEAIVQLKKAIEMADIYNDFNTTAVDAKKLIDQLNINTAVNLLNDKQYDEAIAACKVVLEADPNNGAMYMYIGMAYQALNKEGDAIPAYEKAIELGQAAAAQRLGNIYLSQAQTAQRSTPPKWTTVYDLAKKALAVNESVNANLIFGSAALETKKYQEAITALDKVLSSPPNEQTKTTVIYRLGLAYEGLGRNSQACGYFKQLLNDATYKQIAEHKIKNVLKCE
jgi:tetratricopeptide (TPR) repeat protein